METKEEYILCAAVWFKDGKPYEHQPININMGIVVCGQRHHNCLFTAWALRKGLTSLSEANGKNIQGFLTSKNRFVDRKEAGQIAYKAEQIGKLTDCLFSEDLY